MSNYWDLLCRTCDEKCALDWNRGGDNIQQLIPHLPALAEAVTTLGPLCEILDSGYNLEIVFPNNLTRFAQQHHSHDLIAVDEYGALHGNCVTSYECRCCKTHLQCKKLTGHDGDHGPVPGDEKGTTC